MLRGLFVSLFFCLELSVPPARGQQTQDEMLRLIDMVAQRYAQAQRFHLEATLRNESHGTNYDQSQVSRLSAWMAPGGRFRYDGTDLAGSGLIVSDGSTEWHLARSWGQYTQQSAGSYFGGQTIYGYDDSGILDARSMIGSLRHLDSQLRNLRQLPDESIRYKGRKVHCTVLQYDSGPDHPPVKAPIITVWIDPHSYEVLKYEQQSRSPNYFQGKPLPFAPVNRHSMTTTYTVVDLDFTPTADTFKFMPPAGATKVSELPFLRASKSATSSADDKRFAEYVGKPLPALELADASGTKVAIPGRSGHPLLIDVWATWCGPCVSSLPALDRLHHSLATTDFEIIALDQDDSPKAASNLLHRRGYDWKDFHADQDIAEQLGVAGLPTMLLVDSKGLVVFYQLGADNMKNLTEAIHKLGPQYGSASAE